MGLLCLTIAISLPMALISRILLVALGLLAFQHVIILEES
jgi:hypothetical protein